MEDISLYDIVVISKDFSLSDVKQYINKETQIILKCDIHIYKRLILKTDKCKTKESMNFTIDIYHDSNLYHIHGIQADLYLLGFDGKQGIPYLSKGDYSMNDYFCEKGFTYEAYLVINKDRYKKILAEQ